MRHTIFLFLVPMMISSCNLFKGTGREQNPDADAFKVAKKQLLENQKRDSIFLADDNDNIAHMERYYISDDYIHQATSLIGTVVVVKMVNGHTEVTFENGWNFLKGGAEISTALFDEEKPLFNIFAEKSLATNVSAVKDIKGSLEAGVTYNLNYKTVFAAYPKSGDIVDETKMDRVISKYLGRFNSAGQSMNVRGSLKMIRSVTIKRLAYQKYKKFDAKVTASTLVNVDGALHYAEGQEMNHYEVIVDVVDLIWDSQPELKKGVGSKNEMDEFWHPRLAKPLEDFIERK